MSVAQLYQAAVEALTPAERVRLATMLLETVAPSQAIDAGEEWSDDDLREYREHGQRRAATRLGAED